jgi:hypothetical protein
MLSANALARDLPNPLVTETTSGRNLENRKTLKKSQTVAYRRILHTDTTRNHLLLVYQTVKFFPLGGETYTADFRSVFFSQ